MKNIISHNCVGAEIYKEKGWRYRNPFMWCVIPPDDFYYLYSHYYQIDFSNIELEKEGKFYKIVVDGKINVYYVHYKYNKNATVPKKQNEVDIVYDKIEEYIVEKYNVRLSRMFGKPFFVVTDREYITNKQWNFTKKDIENYLDKDDCIVAVYDRNIKGNNVVYLPEKDMEPKDIAKILSDRI
jgi:uncharacterized protein (DUF1919 family)